MSNCKDFTHLKNRKYRDGEQRAKLSQKKLRCTQDMRRTESRQCPVNSHPLHTMKAVNTFSGMESKGGGGNHEMPKNKLGKMLQETAKIS